MSKSYIPSGKHLSKNLLKDLLPRFNVLHNGELYEARSIQQVQSTLKDVGVHVVKLWFCGITSKLQVNSDMLF